MTLQKEKKKNTGRNMLFLKLRFNNEIFFFFQVWKIVERYLGVGQWTRVQMIRQVKDLVL